MSDNRDLYVNRMGREERLADLKRKLAARDGRPNYAENVAAIRAEIARLETE